MSPAKAPDPGIEALLAGGWRLSDDGRALERSFRFADFAEAFGFMTRAAIWAEKLDHHPDWSNSYRNVHVRLTSHDAGGVTDRDRRLAAVMDRLAGSA